MKQQIGFFILFSLLCGGILLFPYQKEKIEEVPVEVLNLDDSISLRVLRGDRVETMSLTAYLAGVVSAELPESFPMEAKKAQAVAARTYTLRQIGKGKHQGADICTDSACCQAWTPLPYEEGTQAVRETDGLVLIYEDALIEATYFSCSGGRTEDAVSVWGSDIPYLQAVDSPGEEDAPRFREEMELSPESFAARLQTLEPAFLPMGTAPQWFGEIRYTRGHGVDTVEIGGIPFKGTELRSLFGLRSTNIRFSVTADRITISTLGYGHRVGLSQYGAGAMAEEGKSFSEILCHYYRNTKITRLSLPGEAYYSYNVGLDRSVQQGDEQGQQNECSSNPLGDARQLGVHRGALVLAHVALGIACQCAQTIFLAGLESDDSNQCNSGQDLHAHKNVLNNFHNILL